MGIVGKLLKVMDLSGDPEGDTSRLDLEKQHSVVRSDGGKRARARRSTQAGRPAASPTPLDSLTKKVETAMQQGALQVEAAVAKLGPIVRHLLQEIAIRDQVIASLREEQASIRTPAALASGPIPTARLRSAMSSGQGASDMQRAAPLAGEPSVGPHAGSQYDLDWFDVAFPHTYIPPCQEAAQDNTPLVTHKVTAAVHVEGSLMDHDSSILEAAADMLKAHGTCLQPLQWPAEPDSAAYSKALGHADVALVIYRVPSRTTVSHVLHLLNTMPGAVKAVAFMHNRSRAHLEAIDEGRVCAQHKTDAVSYARLQDAANSHDLVCDEGDFDVSLEMNADAIQNLCTMLLAVHGRALET